LSRLKHGVESRWSHHRLCTRQPRNNSTQRSLSAELVAAVFASSEHEPSRQQLLDDLPGDWHLPGQEALPVSQTCLQFALKLLEVDVRHPLEAVETSKLLLKLALPPLSNLDRLDEGGEVATLSHGGREPSQLLIQYGQVGLQGLAAGYQ